MTAALRRLRRSPQRGGDRSSPETPAARPAGARVRAAREDRRPHAHCACPDHGAGRRSPPRSPPHRAEMDPHRAACSGGAGRAAGRADRTTQQCRVVRSSHILPRSRTRGSYLLRVDPRLSARLLRRSSGRPQERPSSDTRRSASAQSRAWHPRSMPLVALTGGIASGKSTIARRLADHGAVVVDADQLVRDVQQPGSPVLAAIAAEFGERMLLPDGSLDRAALGAAVFGDPDGGEAAQRDRASGRARGVGAAVRRGVRGRSRMRSSSTTCRCSSRRASTTRGSSSWWRTPRPTCGGGGSSSCAA